MYQVVVERSAEKDLKKLSSQIRARAATAMQALSHDPRPPGCRKLAGSDSDDWRIRFGDYRIIYQIADEIRIIRINRVRHRREVYN